MASTDWTRPANALATSPFRHGHGWGLAILTGHSSASYTHNFFYEARIYCAGRYAKWSLDSALCKLCSSSPSLACRGFTYCSSEASHLSQTAGQMQVSKANPIHVLDLLIERYSYQSVKPRRHYALCLCTSVCSFDLQRVARLRPRAPLRGAHAWPRNDCGARAVAQRPPGPRGNLHDMILLTNVVRLPDFNSRLVTLAREVQLVATVKDYVPIKWADFVLLTSPCCTCSTPIQSFY